MSGSEASGIRAQGKAICNLVFTIANRISDKMSVYAKKTCFVKIKKYLSNPSVLPGIIVILAAMACGGKNLIQRNGRRKENSLFGSKIGLFGGTESITEDNILNSGLIYASSSETAFELVSFKQPLTISEESASASADFTISDGISLANPNNPICDSDSEELREEIIKYTVALGDTAGAIAEKFGVSLNTVLWANNLSPSSIIKPGNQLDILPVTGVKHTVAANDTLEGLAKKYKASSEEIKFFNGLPSDGTLKVASIIVVPGGILPEAMQPKPKAIIKPAPQYAQAGQTNGYFIYPAAGHNWGRIHANNGIDISNPKGGPIYAAASGSIILADGIGYNGGYGKYVQIKHSNGIVTLYAHLNKIYVSTGQTVRQGSVIGIMGNTGHSTGTHLHFEVRGVKNPLARY